MTKEPFSEALFGSPPHIDKTLVLSYNEGVTLQLKRDREDATTSTISEKSEDYMKLGYTVSSVSSEPTGLLVSFDGDHPSVARLGNVLCYARREQRSAGRTAFSVSDANGGLLFQPTEQVGDFEKLAEDLILLLEGIGFTIATAFEEVLSAIRQFLAAHKQPLAA